MAIDLSNRPDVNGSLDKHFKELQDLEQLNLENTKASGDISLLRNNAKLKYLNLDNTMVFGDLATFQKATELQSLNLYNTMVFGDLATFQKATELQSLNLYNTMVFGDLAALQKATKLQFLNLYNTTVFGDLGAFQTATRLPFRKFEVSNTNITCPQEALKAVLIKLAFQEQQLQDLYAMEGLTWMLSSRSSLKFYCLAARGLTNKFFGEAVQKL